MRQGSPRAVTVALVCAAMTTSLFAGFGISLIPTIAQSLRVSLESAQWVLTIALLAGAVATPVLGRIGDGAGRLKALAFGLTAVAVGSVVAALAETLGPLLLGRALQGVGYAIVPLTISLARQHLEGERRRQTIAALSITVATGVGIGYPLTGVLAEAWDYRAAFWFAAAFSVVALIAVLAAVPREPRHAPRVSLDLPGAVLLGTGLATVLLAVSRAWDWGWGSAPVLGLLALGGALLVTWVTVELRVPAPLVDVRLMRTRAVLATNASAFLIAMGMFGGLALVTRILQAPESTGYGFGSSLLETGLLFVPLALGTLAAQPLSRRLGERFGARGVLPLGALLTALTLTGLALFHGELWAIVLMTALLGAGVGTTFAVMPAVIVASVPPQRTGSAMSLNQVLRSGGGATGSALVITVLAGHRLAGSAHPTDRGFGLAFAVGAACAFAGAVAAWVLMPSPHGAELGLEHVS